MDSQQGYMITLESTGQTFRCSPDKTILKAMESLGRKDIRVGCRAGGCGICRVLVLEGRVEAGQMSRAQVTCDDELAGIVLACKAKPQSDIRLRILGLKPLGERAASPGAEQPAQFAPNQLMKEN